MIESDVQAVLNDKYCAELGNSLIASYENAISEYKKNHWQYFGNEIGQFIEVARRMIEMELDKKYTPLSKKLSNFNEKVLTAWENYDSQYAEVYRIVIPRCLYSMYCLRNKRGMIHKNNIDPNKMDATVLLGNAKWVLAEFFRMKSAMTFEESEEIINSIMNKETSLLWDIGSAMRILDTKINTKDKILCLLYFKDGQSDEELRNSIEYQNSTTFKRILSGLHKEKMIEYTNIKCLLSPIGVKRVENLLEG